jgi:predicted ribosome quality control (RQC) complex YloA/Tae2 family protein
VAVEAIGPNGNLWLLDTSGGIRATLRKKDFTEGDPYQPAPLPDKPDPLSLTAAHLSDMCRGNDDSGSLVTRIDRGITGLNRTMALEAVKRADLDFVDPAECSETDLQSLRDTINEMGERFKNPDAAYLYQVRGMWEAYPFKLKSREEQPEKFKTLSLAILETVGRKQEAREEETEQQTVMQAVRRGVKRIEKRIQNLEKDIAQAEDYEKFKQIGDLLQIHRADIKKGMDRIELTDMYHPDAPPIKVKLDPAISPQENIENYFRKHRKGREGLETLERRLEISRSELDELKTIESALETNFDQAKERYAAELQSLLPREAGKRETVPRLPYREYQLSSGVTIFVGKDGSDNDRTTFEFAKPWELWFHTQQCPGSHVVLKFPNKSFEPSRREIEETAAIAAWHSKARNDSLVPVVYTERKYVRKPRKAKPGLVTVERETSVMVEPRPPE